MESPPSKTSLQELVDRDLEETEGPRTAVALCEAAEGNYALASGEIYKRTGRVVPPNTVRNWHRAALASA